MVGPSFCPCGSSVSASAPRAHLTVRASAAVTASASTAAAVKMLNFRIDPSRYVARAPCAESAKVTPSSPMTRLGKVYGRPGRLSRGVPVKCCGASAQSLSTKPRIERVAQPVAKQVHGEYQRGERDAGEDCDPPFAGEQVFLPDLDQRPE